MAIRLKEYGRNHIKRKEYIHQSGLLLAGVDVITAKHDACIGTLEVSGPVSDSGMKETGLNAKQPLQPSASISDKFKQKFFFMTPMRYMPNVTWKEMPFCSCHLPVIFS
jgi:hypothetical protein